MGFPVTVLWSIPRSVSTSFERMVIARGDHTVFDEPFSRHYYFGPDRQSPRYTETLPDSSVDDILAAIDDAAQSSPVFVKDMAYQATGQLTPERLAQWRNCFMVRDPAAAIPSLARVWPDFTPDETGWEALGRAFDVTVGLGQEPVVVDAETLCADPPAVVRTWCEQMDIAFDPEALTWPPGMQADWELWSEWHESSSTSTGFAPLSPASGPPEEPRQAEAHAHAEPIYQRLAAHAIGR